LLSECLNGDHEASEVEGLGFFLLIPET